MRTFMHSGFFWKFIGGFAIGAVGIVTLNPAQAGTVLAAVEQVVR